jgi:hypothetical protein
MAVKLARMAITHTAMTGRLNSRQGTKTSIRSNRVNIPVLAENPTASARAFT